VLANYKDLLDFNIIIIRSYVNCVCEWKMFIFYVYTTSDQ